MIIINGKLNTEELSRIYTREEPCMGEIRDLSIYNDTPYFNIKKVYNNGNLIGYVVISLAYNSAMSNDASIEDIAYWNNAEEINYAEIGEFLKEVINSKDYPIDIERFYYDPEQFDEQVGNILASLGCLETTRVR